MALSHSLDIRHTLTKMTSAHHISQREIQFFFLLSAFNHRLVPLTSMAKQARYCQCDTFKTTALTINFVHFWKTNFICYTKWHFIWNSPSWKFIVQYALLLWWTLKPKNHDQKRPGKICKSIFRKCEKISFSFQMITIAFCCPPSSPIIVDWKSNWQSWISVCLVNITGIQLDFRFPLRNNAINSILC